MKDIELRSRLIDLGMSPARADGVTRQIRDVVHPVAVVAAEKMQDHAMGVLCAQQMPDVGMAGYELDQMSGLFKSVKKAVKKVGKTVGKVASKAATVLAPVVPYAAVAAAGIGVAKGIKSSKKAKKARKAETAAAAAAAAAAPPVDAAAVPSVETPSSQLAQRNRARVPRKLVNTAGQVAAAAVQQGVPADPAAIMQALLANQGTNMVSPAAQSVVREVAQEGVEQTTAGPSSIPSWLLPALAVGFGAAILLPKGNQK